MARGRMDVSATGVPAALPGVGRSSVPYTLLLASSLASRWGEESFGMLHRKLAIGRVGLRIGSACAFIV